MEHFECPDEVRARIAAWREAGDSIALVPMMGNVHSGHLSLVELAAAQASRARAHQPA